MELLRDKASEKKAEYTRLLPRVLSRSKPGRYLKGLLDNTKDSTFKTAFLANLKEIDKKLHKTKLLYGDAQILMDIDRRGELPESSIYYLKKKRAFTTFML